MVHTVQCMQKPLPCSFSLYIYISICKHTNIISYHYFPCNFLYTHTYNPVVDFLFEDVPCGPLILDVGYLVGCPYRPIAGRLLPHKKFPVSYQSYELQKVCKETKEIKRKKRKNESMRKKIRKENIKMKDLALLLIFHAFCLRKKIKL